MQTTGVAPIISQAFSTAVLQFCWYYCWYILPIVFLINSTFCYRLQLEDSTFPTLNMSLILTCPLTLKSTSTELDVLVAWATWVLPPPSSTTKIVTSPRTWLSWLSSPAKRFQAGWSPCPKTSVALGVHPVGVARAGPALDPGITVWIIVEEEEEEAAVPEVEAVAETAMVVVEAIKVIPVEVGLDLPAPEAMAAIILAVIAPTWIGSIIKNFSAKWGAPSCLWRLVIVHFHELFFLPNNFGQSPQTKKRYYFSFQSRKAPPPICLIIIITKCRSCGVASWSKGAIESNYNLVFCVCLPSRVSYANFKSLAPKEII